jgi:uncharacterized UPF0160 family protein
MGLNEVFRKVSAINGATELSSGKVELGMLQDVMSLVNNADKARGAANKKVVIISQKAQEAVAALVEANNVLTRANNGLDTLIKNTKSLGLDVSPQVLKAKETVVAKQATVTNQINKIQAIKVEQV